MVRIQQRNTKRTYLKGKRVYSHSRQYVCIQRRFHDITAPFIKQDLEENVTVKAGSLVITLSPKKNAPGES